MHVLTTTILIREYGTVSKKSCCSCGRQSVYDVKYPDGRPTLELCSWCDLPNDERWMR